MCSFHNAGICSAKAAPTTFAPSGFRWLVSINSSEGVWPEFSRMEQVGIDGGGRSFCSERHSSFPPPVCVGYSIKMVIMPRSFAQRAI